jgi:Mn-containing catalase
MVFQGQELPCTAKSAIAADPRTGAIVGGTDVQAALVAGAGAGPVDSNGNPW